MKYKSLVKRSKLILIVLLFRLLTVKFCFAQDTEDMSNKIKTPKKIIVLMYDRKEKREKVVYFILNGNSIKKIKEFYLNNVRFWHRNMRWISRKGKLVYISSNSQGLTDKEEYNPYDKFTPYDPSENEKTFILHEQYEIQVSNIMISTLKKSLIVWPLYLYYKNTVDLLPDYFITNEADSYILQRHYLDGTVLSFFNIDNTNKVQEPDLKHLLIKGQIKENTSAPDRHNYFFVMNPCMSPVRENISFYAVSKKDLLNDFTYNLDSDHMADNNFHSRWNLYFIRSSKRYRYKDYVSSYFDQDKMDVSKVSTRNSFLLVNSFPLYKRGKGVKFFPIPHKCWSPSGNFILFAGALEEPGKANVYKVNIWTEKIEKIFAANNMSGSFNPDLEWTKYGILITCKEAIYLKRRGKDIKKLIIPNEIHQLSGGKISSDGRKIFFFGMIKKSTYLFIYDTVAQKTNRIIISKKQVDALQGSWIYTDRHSIIKNEFDYYYHIKYNRWGIRRTVPPYSETMKEMEMKKWVE